MVVIKLKTSAQQAFPEKYNALNDFYKDINTYEEISFEYCKQKFLVTYYDNKLSVAEYNKPDTEQFFKSPEDFAENFRIDNIRFQDFVTKISVLIR
ncbi:hypothetical protein [Sporomusa sp. KB1]|uniref:hypothetical protein n=1 Tax=Sporomusa sp. KB1 TaxID=943346 RepID=UPI0011A98926|nr:hypothetical protein [Sporomusa sp. KB1]TWH45486.1 hypothetical protein Salpa_1399 [Sporomusa sp. KB1]